ncbi:MAG: hypothetical protein R6X21_04320, partial [Candidatus Aminicenantes bacterium]
FSVSKEMESVLVSNANRPTNRRAPVNPSSTIFFWVGWFLWAGVLLVLGMRHPRLVDEDEPLSRKRKALSLVVLLIFVLSFIPDPVRGFDLRTVLKGFGVIAG